MPNLPPTSAKLLRLLTERPGQYDMRQLCGELRTSKTQVRAALTHLEDENLIRIDYDD